MKLSEKFHFVRTALETAAISLLSKRAGARHVANRLSELPGVPAKVGQLLAMKADVAPSSRQQGYQMPPQTVLELLAREVPRLADEIAEFDTHAKAASLSQVHRAMLRDGRVVAIKVQLPGLAQVMEEQLTAAFDALRKYGPRAISERELAQFKEYFRNSLLQELDYEAELAEQNHFREDARHCHGLVIPLAYPELSTSTVLTQEYVAAESIDAISLLPEPEKRRVAEQLVSIQLAGIFKSGVVHGDLHPGNWGYDAKNGGIVFYDFGSVVRLLRPQADTISKLISFGRGTSSLEYLSAYSDLGFDVGKITQIADALPELTSLLFAPLREAERWNIKEWHLSERIESLLGDRKWQFRLAGPAWFFGLMRSCRGITHAVGKLDIPMNFLDLYRQTMENADGRNKGVQLFPSAKGFASGMPHASKNLKIQIMDDAKELVYLEFPASSAGELDRLIPEEIRKKIEFEGIILSEIAKRAVRSGFAPQELFSGDFHSRTYRVWLE